MNEKQKRFFSVLVLLAAAAAVWLVLRQKEAQTAYTKNIFAMDTLFTLKAYGPEAEEALDAAEIKVRELEKLFSVNEEGSDIWRINHACGDFKAAAGQAGTDTDRDGINAAVVSPDTLSAVRTALQLGSETGGALDITIYPVLREWGFTTDTFQIPGEERLRELTEKVDYRQVALDEEQKAVCVPEGVELDLGALAKGYAGDCLIRDLRDAGVESAILDLGGNVQTLGTKPDGSLWRVAVKNPFDPGEELGVLRAADQAVVTSGSYERFFTGEDGRRYGHILNPADGRPADNGLASVTVAGESGVVCDGLSTALFVMGRERAVQFWRERQDFEMILVTEDRELYITEGLADRFEGGKEWNARMIRSEDH